MLRVEGAQVEAPVLDEIVPSAGGWTALTAQCYRQELEELVHLIGAQAKVCSVFRKIEE